MSRQATPRPMLACLMSLTHGRATMLEHVAGVTVTPSMRDMLEAEAAQSKAFAQARSVDRLALQIIGVKLMGYAGVHLSGVHELKQLLALEARIEHWQAQIHTLEQWAPAWQASWQMPGLPAVSFHPPQASWRQGESRVDASFKEKARYHLMHGMHSLLFSRRNSLSKAFGWAVRQPMWATRLGSQVLHKVEHAVKHPLVGCDTCGRCRLEDTLYICRKPAQGPGQRPLRRHRAEPLRVRRPRMHPQRQVPHRQGGAADGAADRAPDPVHRARDTPPQLMAAVVPGPDAASAQPAASASNPARIVASGNSSAMNTITLSRVSPSAHSASQSKP